MKTNFENIGGSYSQQGDYLFQILHYLMKTKVKSVFGERDTDAI